MAALLEGKQALVLGVANKRSIAWAISQALANAGATLAFTYQGERLEENVRELAATVRSPLVLSCDVSRDEEIDRLFETVDKQFGGLDILVHCIAFAQRADLEAGYLSTSREGFRIAHDVSAYSLVSLARGAAPLMEKRGAGAILALTYLGSERVIPKYNVMGVAKAALESSIRYLANDLGPRNVRVNGISSGPISTLSARGIPGFTKMLQYVREKAPLQRNTDPAEVGDAGLFLCSPMARGITGEVLYVDCGYHIMGM
ncbi:MAG: enoyl-ACP reductase [Acidobacteriota bacterium]